MKTQIRKIAVVPLYGLRLSEEVYGEGPVNDSYTMGKRKLNFSIFSITGPLF
jgi:hypothetical protein